MSHVTFRRDRDRGTPVDPAGQSGPTSACNVLRHEHTACAEGKRV